MSQGDVLAFEDVGADLARPPLSAVRFFHHAGVRLLPRVWRALPHDVRRAMVAEGARDDPNPEVAQALVRNIPLRDLELAGHRKRRVEDEPEDGLLSALGVGPNFRHDVWVLLSPFHRFVLNQLFPNTRLLWRAYEEISGTPAGPAAHWSGLLAHAEVQINAKGSVRRDLLHLLGAERLLEGRALLLARASGLRAARSACDTFDLYADTMTGIVELDWRVNEALGVAVWQAHASTHLGAFFPTASLAAAATAAVCLYDMIKEFDPDAVVQSARVVEEEWQVGKYDWEEPTRFFTAPR